MLQCCLLQNKSSCHCETKCSPRMAEEHSWRYSSQFAIATVALLVLASAATPLVNGAPLPQGHNEHRRIEQHRQLCLHYSTHTTLSCNFHDSCIESLLPCGNKGFALSYAQYRCNHARRFRQSVSDCPHCLHHQTLVDWALETEKCLQSELTSLAKQYASRMASRHPDPPECLRFEREALKSLTTCYQSKKSSLCQLMASGNVDTLTTLKKDLVKVVSVFNRSEYYAAAVHGQLQEMLQSCGHPEADRISKKVFPSQRKIRFCAAPTNIESVDLVQKVAEHLGRSKEEFVIAGTGDVDSRGDLTDQSICRLAAPAGSALLTGFQIIQWTPQPDDNKPEQLRDNHAYTIPYSPSTQVKYFIYSNEANNSRACGNGRREAGELCDVFANTGMNRFGCDKNCLPFTGYECSLAQLTNSTCHPTQCGDGQRTADEACDTGEVSDGCNSSCQIQAGYFCPQNSYNTTSVCTPVPATPSLSPPPTISSQRQSSHTHSPSTSQSQTSLPSRSSPASPQQLTSSSSASSHWRTHSLLSGLLPVFLSFLVGPAFLLTHR